MVHTLVVALIPLAILATTGVLIWLILDWKRVRGVLFNLLAIGLILVGVGTTFFGAAEWNGHCVGRLQAYSSDPVQEKLIIEENIRREQEAGKGTAVPFNVALPLTFLGVSVSFVGVGMLIRKYGG